MNHDESVQKMIDEKGLNAPRITPAHIDSLIVRETFTELPSGKVMVCELTLKNGFTVRGEGSAVSRENFNVEVGMQVSRKKAWDKIWELEGYLLQQRLYEAQDAIGMRTILGYQPYETGATTYCPPPKEE